MVDDVRWGLLIVASVGIALNYTMMKRLNHDIRMARDEALLDSERAHAVLSRRRQSIGLLVMSIALAASSLFRADSWTARLLVLLVAATIVWKSVRLFVDRLQADVMAAERLRTDRDDTPRPGIA